MSSFSADIAKWTTTVEKKLAAVISDTVYEVANRLVMRTPADTGHLRYNWQMDIDKIPDTEVNGFDLTGSRTLARIRTRLNTADYFKAHKFYVVNTTPYVGIVEYGGFPNPVVGGKGKTVAGFSTQAPAGMVGITQVEFPQIAADVISRVAAEGNIL